MKKTVLIVASAITLTLTSAVVGTKLGKFGSSTEKSIGPKTIKVPYTDVISYLGYAEKGSEDEIINGKKFTFIYVWIPAVAPELGVRMMSPVDGYAPKKATEASNYEANKKSKEFFDTYVTLEKSSITSSSNISEANVKSATWTTLASNDDSSEMPKDPKGNSYNSLLRYKSQTSSPTKALTKGLYRIGFTTYKKGEVQGNFVAEVGSPIKLPGVVIDKELSNIIKGIK